jgi:hypothetical protein
MSTFKTQAGIWTRRVAVRKKGTWRTSVLRPWIIDDRFQQARFILVGGPTVLVSAGDLRRALAATTAPGRLICSVRIDPEKSTINGQPVHFMG